jgi:altronate hydrolase
MQESTPTLKISEKDNLWVALKDLMPGQQVIADDESFNLNEKIPAKHKFAGQDFSAGDLAYMYGVLVGEATKPIRLGERITTQNLIHRSAEFSSSKRKDDWVSPSTDRWQDKSFLGYRRNDGRVGTANYWLVVPWYFVKMEMSRCSEGL